MAISINDAENVEFKFSRLRRHLKLYTFLFKINYLLHQFTLMEFTEVVNSGNSLIYETKMEKGSLR